MLVKKLKNSTGFFIFGIEYYSALRRGGRRKRKREEGGRWALACAAHQIEQFLCKRSIVFFWLKEFWLKLACYAMTFRD